jgi:VanZ family protein
MVIQGKTMGLPVNDERLASIAMTLGRIGFVCGIIAVTTLSLLPQQMLPDLPLWDKLEHLLAYGLLALTGGLGFPGWRAQVRIATLLFVLGVLVEGAQAFVPGRDASVGDALANALGIGFGMGTARFASALLLTRAQAAST